MASSITPQGDAEMKGLDSQRNISKSSWVGPQGFRIGKKTQKGYKKRVCVCVCVCEELILAESQLLLFFFN